MITPLPAGHAPVCPPPAHPHRPSSIPDLPPCRPPPPSSAPQVLKTFKEFKNCVECCNRDGLMKHLEKQQGELEICEKALADYMESKRRAFPRFYFVSTADLLDILSNGNNPVRVMQHMSKCFQVGVWGRQ